MNSEKIKKGKYVFQSIIESLSPLHIGSGDDNRSDMDILLDEDNMPFIPATSFVGVLRHTIKPENDTLKQDLEKFWGFIKDKDGQQSRVYCSDLTCHSKNPKIVIRDGICIDNETGIVREKEKFNYEILERGTQFKLKMEFDFTETSLQFVNKMIATIYHLLKHEKLLIGAKTNNGLGCIRLIDQASKLYMFDFSQKAHVFRWINQYCTDDNLIQADNLASKIELKYSQFKIDATFELKNSFIIRSYSKDPKMPDATHLKSHDNWVLAGSSLKGAIRSRAERIVNTLEKPPKLISDLFGYIDDKSAKKGKVRVYENILPKFISELHTRIKIDRFTGGTIESALFDTMPIFTSFNDKVIEININIRDGNKSEIGLILLVLKDLWTGDLAVGGEKNIGRGIFQGISAIIEHHDKKILVDRDFKPDNEEEEKFLKSFVEALNSKEIS